MALCTRLSEIGYGVPSCWAKKETPQLLDHPADIGHLGRDQLGFGILASSALYSDSTLCTLSM